MTSNISQGSDFGGAINYVMNRKEVRLLATKGVRQGSNESMANSFEIQARLNPIAKPVSHISLNFSPEDRAKISDELMIKVASEYLEKMGYGNTQFMLARHLDREHPHCHLIINRVDFGGNRITDKNEKRRNAKVCRELTEKYGLHISEGKMNVKLDRLRPSERAKHEIYFAIKEHLPNCKSWAELQDKLRRDGVGVEFKYKGSTDKIEGVKFTKDDWSFSGSKVDKQFSYSKIDYAIRHNAYEESQRVAEVQRLSQPTPSHQQREEFGGGGLGLFDLPMGAGDDPDEETFRHQMQKKKKPQIKMKF